MLEGAACLLLHDRPRVRAKLLMILYEQETGGKYGRRRATDEGPPACKQFVSDAVGAAAHSHLNYTKTTTVDAG